MIKDKSKIEFDLSEFFLAIAELIGLFLILAVEPTPTTVMEISTVFVHVYGMVYIPVGNAVHTVCVNAYAVVSIRRSS
jgi:hypothetical protein